NVNLSEYIWVKLFHTGLPTNPLIREIFGFIVVLAYLLAIPPLLAKKGLSRFYTTLGPARFYVMTFLLLVIAALPIKMVLRWLFTLKYIIGIPEYFLNIKRSLRRINVSSETPNEGGHKKPPIPAPAKKIPAYNIERRGDRLHQVVTLHKWFA